MKAALSDAIRRIKEAGFDHIKVELEGDIGRDGERSCEDCLGEGSEECYNCDGEGYSETGARTRISDEPVRQECSACYGEGYNRCDNCDGQGNFGNFMDEETCEQWMKDYVPQEVRDRLVYGRFYEDGSVDSEFTFTVHIDHVEDVVTWMNAFSALADECGSGMEVSDAGLHIAVLPSGSRGVYPCYDTMNRRSVNNFTSEVTKLMPALFFLASAGHQSRNLEYRHPKVDEDKYAAVSTHENTCYEFRVFETCYDRPEAFYDYIQTIANCLKFHADPTLKVATLGKQFGFNDGETLSRLYNTPEQLRILNATVKHLKPVDKSYKKLKEERGVHYTIKSLSQKEKSTLAKLREEYKQYKANWDAAWEKPLNDEQKERVRQYRDEGMSERTAEGYVRGVGSGRLQPMTEFIKSNLPNHHNYYDEFVTC